MELEQPNTKQSQFTVLGAIKRATGFSESAIQYLISHIPHQSGDLDDAAFRESSDKFIAEVNALVSQLSAHEREQLRKKDFISSVAIQLKIAKTRSGQHKTHEMIAEEKAARAQKCKDVRAREKGKDDMGKCERRLEDHAKLEMEKMLKKGWEVEIKYIFEVKKRPAKADVAKAMRSTVVAAPVMIKEEASEAEEADEEEIEVNEPVSYGGKEEINTSEAEPVLNDADVARTPEPQRESNDETFEKKQEAEWILSSEEEDVEVLPMHKYRHDFNMARDCPFKPLKDLISIVKDDVVTFEVIKDIQSKYHQCAFKMSSIVMIALIKMAICRIIAMRRMDTLKGIWEYAMKALKDKNMNIANPMIEFGQRKISFDEFISRFEIILITVHIETSNGR